MADNEEVSLPVLLLPIPEKSLVLGLLSEAGQRRQSHAGREGGGAPGGVDLLQARLDLGAECLAVEGDV